MSNQIRKHIGKKDKYEVGETLICRVYKKFGSKRFNVNYLFKIVSLKMLSQRNSISQISLP